MIIYLNFFINLVLKYQDQYLNYLFTIIIMQNDEIFILMLQIRFKILQ